MRPEAAFVQSESAEWPSNWTTAVLREVCLKTSLVDPGRMPDGEFNYVDVSAVSSESLRIVGSSTVKGATAPSRARKLLHSHDVIFATVRPTLRRIALVPPNLEGHLASTAFCVLRADANRIDPSFLYYTLITEEFVQRIGALERGASYPAVSDGNVLDQEILVPPLAEQRAIAGVLSKLQAAVEIQDRIVATLKELKTAAMAKLFREGLRGEPLKLTEIGEIPESWGVVELGSAVKSVSGGTPSKARLEWWQGRIPWASPKDMKTPRLFDTEDHISAEALAAGSRLVPSKTIFVVTRGMILAKDIPVAIAEVPMAFNQDMRAFLPGDLFDPDYLLYAITAGKAFLTAEIGTSAHGTRRLGSVSVEALLVPVPDPQEQQRIAGVLRNLDERSTAAKESVHALRTLFAETLRLLMTGRQRLRTPALEGKC